MSGRLFQEVSGTGSAVHGCWLKPRGLNKRLPPLAYLGGAPGEADQLETEEHRLHPGVIRWVRHATIDLHFVRVCAVTGAQMEVRPNIGGAQSIGREKIAEDFVSPAPYPEILD